MCGRNNKTGQDLAKRSSEGDGISSQSASRRVFFPLPQHISKLLHVCRNASHLTTHTVHTAVKSHLSAHHGLTHLSGCFFKVLQEGLVSGAGRTILPSPEDSPTIPGLFSKVWEAEPTWRQHYRPPAGGEENNTESDKFSRCSAERKHEHTFCDVVPLRTLALSRLRNSHPDPRRQGGGWGGAKTRDWRRNLPCYNSL